MSRSSSLPFSVTLPGLYKSSNPALEPHCVYRTTSIDIFALGINTSEADTEDLMDSLTCRKNSANLCREMIVTQCSVSHTFTGV